MASVLVRDLPESVLRALHLRASASSQSLQQYLADELTRLASRPTMQEVLARIGRRRGGAVGGRAAVEALRNERERR
jgi:hypothetical protein